MVMKNLLLATEAGLGNGETPIFPIQIFRVKEGVNFNPGEPNYDLFQLAMPAARAKRLFPNFSFHGRAVQPAVLQARPPGDGDRLYGLPHPGHRQRIRPQPARSANGRGNLSFTSINLPRLAIKAKGDMDWFFEDLDRMIDLCVDQLLERFEIQCPQKGAQLSRSSWARAYGWTREKLGWNDEVREVLKHGTLSVGFIGLAETPEGPDRRAPRREREGPDAGSGDHRPHAGPDGRGKRRSGG